ncbi:hypothetical protein [Xylanimonas protaetiae]|uniref:Uncharacterized protein n=1 Tax=Xylanimonas protaetiae TaxID=2509457 RepID=A0A4P6F6F8_9MICO|nr:hypothetical protein [Xylanimonas protaetiae]QAY71016.1 hypothetical protein ET471_14060 [Xylanimonas protaetiae]
MIRRSILVVVLAATVGVLLVAVGGADVPHAVLLVVLALAGFLALGGLPSLDAPWPKPPTENRPGGRKDVSELSWAAFTRDGLVTERVLRRVRLIAARRLADHGVLWDGRLGTDLDGWGRDDRDAAEHREQAAALLGPDLLASLSTARAVTPRALEAWFRELDRLVEAPAAARTPDDPTPEDPASDPPRSPR